MSQLVRGARTEIDWANEAIKRAESGHALFGPSTLPRVFRCRRSTRFCLENDAPNVQTAAAQEGSDCHALAQRAFEYQREAAVFEGCDFQYMHHGNVRVFNPTEEQCRIVQAYIDWCQELPGDHFVETRVNLATRMPVPNQFGSTDHGAIYGRTLVVTDLKAGFIMVYAEENEQAMAYALGLYDEWSDFYDIDKIVIRIAQPRQNHWDVWECTTEHLLAWADKLYGVIEDAISDDAKFTPGEKQCEFCPMSGRCGAQTEYKNRILQGDFDAFDDDQSVVQALTNDQLSQAADSIGFVEQWCKSVRKRIFEALCRGEDVHNRKIVEGKSNRAYINPKSAEQYLRDQKLKADQIFTAPKLVGPATAEKLLKGDAKKKFLAEYVCRPPGKPILALATDSRPPYSPGSDDFDSFEVESSENSETGED